MVRAFLDANVCFSAAYSAKGHIRFLWELPAIRCDCSIAVIYCTEEEHPMAAITTRYDGRAFVPDEPLNLPLGQVAVLHIPESSDGTVRQSMSSRSESPISLPSGKSVWEWMAENPIDDPNLPPDLSENLDD